MTEETERKISKNTEKRRAAICGGTLGRENRYYIRGQVVDISVSEEMTDPKKWDLLTGLFQGQEKEITPFLDYGLESVRKPILVAEIVDQSGKVLHRSPEIRGDESGFFFHEFTFPLAPGNYTFHIHFLKPDSYRQFGKDLAYLNTPGKHELVSQSLIGMGALRILSEEYTGIVTTSDIDQTYLATDIHSNKGKISTLFETPEQKLPLPGMPTLFKELREATTDSPLCFISASPHFFRRTLLSTFRTQGVKTESLHLKYLEGTLKGMVDKFWDTLSHPTRFLTEGLWGAVERVRKFAGSSFQSLFDQLAYKLTILLRDRIYLPTNSTEILLGDNTESDYLIFTLYQFILTGALQGKELEDYLYKLNFLGRDAITRDNAKLIRELAEENRRIHGDINPVQLVLINKTELGPPSDEMKWNVRSALPTGLDPWKTEGIAPYIPTDGALGFALVMVEREILDLSSVLKISGDMAGQWFEGKVIEPNVLLELAKKLELPVETESIHKKFVKTLKEVLEA
ncbi:phosphatase domain-containing protein [Leptospira koniambonensis]|uniref:phosphatase domain-containing protein n=1 Tax=Leptospira koniambonensis TaxID=2484950 RepID=UPI003EBE4438